MTVEEKIREVLVYHLSVKPEQVMIDTNLIEDLGADSLDCIEICMDLEDQLNIEIPDEDFQKCKTVKDMVDMLTPKIGTGTGSHG